MLSEMQNVIHLGRARCVLCTVSLVNLAVNPFLVLIFTHLGLGNSSVVGPALVGQLATAFLDTLYKA